MVRIILIIVILAGLIGYGFYKITLPGRSDNSSLEGKVKALEDSIVSIKADLKTSPGFSPRPSTDFEARIKALEQDVAKLKNQNVSTAYTAPASKPPLYIPLGSGGIESTDQNWYSLDNYSATIDTQEYPGMKSISLEVNMKLNQTSGAGYARLYNITDNSAITYEASTTSDKYSWVTTSAFNLPSGKKTYQLQVKSGTGTIVYIQSARIKVNF